MKIFLITVNIILLTSIFLVAQPKPGPPPPDPDIVPITGIEYLLLGGGAYGVYRFSKRKKNVKKRIVFFTRLLIDCFWFLPVVASVHRDGGHLLHIHKKRC